MKPTTKTRKLAGWAWFIGLWCAGVSGLGVVAVAIKGLIHFL